MSRPPENNRAIFEAKRLARLYRRAGYPDAAAAPQYCIDELGPDGFYTYTVSVYVGKKPSETAQAG
jgi:hypothetical protein